MRPAHWPAKAHRDARFWFAYIVATMTLTMIVTSAVGVAVMMVGVVAHALGVPLFGGRAAGAACLGAVVFCVTTATQRARSLSRRADAAVTRRTRFGERAP